MSQTYHFQTNDTTTNDNHLLWDLGQSQSTGAGDDSLLIDGQAGEGGRFTSGSNNDVLSTKHLLATLKQIDLDSVGINEGTGALDVVDAVLLQQELDTFRQTFDGSVLRLHHLLEVELDIANLNTTLFRVVENLVVEVGVVQEGF